MKKDKRESKKDKKDSKKEKELKKDQKTVKKNSTSQEPKLKTLVIDSASYKTALTKKFQNRKSFEGFHNNILTAFIPGTITDVYVKEGDQVTKGQDLLILEAMKMLNEIKAPFDSVVKSIQVKKDERVTKNQVLVELEYVPNDSFS